MVVLVPGASGGFGRILCGTLASRGMKVIGTARTPESVEAIPRVPVLPMQVTDDASVEQCVKEVVAREGRIDAVVNCVNQMVIGSVEEQSVDEVRALYETNVFGALRLYQHVIPQMRAQGSGTIVTMSSLGGIVAVPLMSAYTSAKFALEAMSEAMYHELAPEGIEVVIMQPVAMAMDRPATGAHLETVRGVADDSPSHRMVQKMALDTAASGLTPEAVAEKVHEVLTMPNKPLRVPMDRARVLGLVKRVAPQSALNRLVRGLLKDV